MPRSFLVKKGNASPHTSTQQVPYRHHGTGTWSLYQNYSDITLLEQHLIKLSRGHIDKESEPCGPLDYSIKKTKGSIPSPLDDSATADDKLEKDAFNFDITDGRSRKRKNKVVSDSQPKFACGECGKHYATSSNLSRHKQTHRSMDSTQAKKCPHCSKVYVSMPALSMHILTHKLKHVCPHCDKAFSRPWLLQGHMRSHTGERPYGCLKCGKKFADRSNLRAHMQTHVDTKRYKCDKCEKTFTLKSYLSKHIELSCADNS